jgi:hypothetical protein
MHGYGSHTADLVASVVGQLGRPELSGSVLLRAVAYWRRIDPRSAPHGLGLQPVSNVA